jgi:hypothetical protein
VMLKDALTTSHPVSTPISTPDDIAQTFDTISYSKVMMLVIHVFSSMFSVRVRSTFTEVSTRSIVRP